MDSSLVSVYNLSSQLLSSNSRKDTPESYHLWMFDPQRREIVAENEELGYFFIF